MAWQPAQYLQFGERLRPAVDLLARIPLEHPRTIVDLGCGAGNVTRLLSERWPDAHIVGVDSSPEMLDEARAATAGDTRYQFVTADLATWEPDAPVDLVYSNAALHWLPGHAALFSRVAAMVAPGGVLAVQMPDNFRAPSHTTIADIARSERWRARLGPIVREPPVAAAADYLQWLAPVTKGEWEVENVGIAPDVEVEQDPALTRQGHDPQLERAVELALEALAKSPAPKLVRPPYPNYGIRLPKP